MRLRLEVAVISLRKWVSKNVHIQIWRIEAALLTPGKLPKKNKITLSYWVSVGRSSGRKNQCKGSDCIVYSDSIKAGFVFMSIQKT